MRTIEPHTEADPVAILLQTLAAYGSAARYRVEADDHRGNLFVALVGSSAKGRKGTSFGRVRELFARADLAWCERIVGGLFPAARGSSGRCATRSRARSA